MNIKCLEVGDFEVNCYVVTGAANEALVIDPGADAVRILAHLRKSHLTVAVYLITHGHIDHISALADMYQAQPAPIAIHRKDLAWAFSPANEYPPFYAALSQSEQNVRPFDDDQDLNDAGLRYQVLTTPGHTPGGVCYYFAREGVLFTGDTLFAGSVGRTDLAGGNSRGLARSLARITALPEATRILPGHGPESTLEHEKQTNPFLQ